MNWPELLVGAAIGAAGGHWGKPVFTHIDRRVASVRDRRLRRRRNDAGDALAEHIDPLSVWLGGWRADGYFDPTSITVQLSDEPFVLDPELRRVLREPNEATWAAGGATNDLQVGIRSIQTRGVERGGHRRSELWIEARPYRYFDLLATHVLRFTGTDVERRVIAEAIGVEPPPAELVPGFPNPWSVGLALLCEGGDLLVLPRRAPRLVRGGKLFNAVGENAEERDFPIGVTGARITTPEQIGRRGLYEEVGLSEADLDDVDIRIHTVAWDREYLDFKAFGTAVSPLSRADVTSAWRSASWRDEAAGAELSFRPVAKRDDCRDLVEEIAAHRSDWAHEAVICTLRSLIVLGRLGEAEIGEILSEHAPQEPTR